LQASSLWRNVHTQKRRALQQYEKQLGQHITAELKPSKTLQAELPETFHRRVPERRMGAYGIRLQP